MGAKSTDRTWLAGGAAGAILLLVIAWFAVISPELSTASDLRTQTDAASSQNLVLQRKVSTLRADFAKLDSLKTELAAQREALPTDSGLPDFTRQLTEQATVAGESLTSITTGAPVLATSTATAAAAAPAAAGSTATTAGQLLAIPVTVVVNGALDGHRALLESLQQIGPRRALVSSVVLAPATGATTASVNGTTTMTLTLQVFVAPQATAATTTPSAVPTPSTTTPG